MNLREWLLLLLLSLIWGGSFFFNEIILRELKPFTLVLGRTAIGALILVAVIYLTGEKLPLSRKTWWDFCVMGMLNNLIPFSLIVWGQQYIDSGLAAVLNANTPLFSVVLAHFMIKEEFLTLNRIVGVIVGIVGVVVLIGPDVLSGFGEQGAAQLAILGASASYALAFSLVYLLLF